LNGLMIAVTSFIDFGSRFRRHARRNRRRIVLFA
jgi:hypothetical protein